MTNTETTSLDDFFAAPVELTVAKLSEKGEGIAFCEGSEIYIEGVITGDVVLCNVGAPFVVGSKRRPATVISFVKKSPNHEESPITQQLLVGGSCPLALMTYESQLALKDDMIAHALNSAGVNAKILEHIYKSPIDDPSRFKSIRFFGKDSDGKVIQGFYKPRSHTVVAVDSFPLEPSWFSVFANELSALMTAKNISVYDETNAVGCARALLLRDAKEGGALAMLIVNDMPDDAFVEEFKKLAAAHDIKAIFINHNQSRGNKIIDGEIVSLGSIDEIKVSLADLQFNVGPQTFMQVNYAVAEAMYKKAVAWCGENKDAVALDLCCGVGSMSLMLASKFKKAIGVELFEGSVAAANDNAKLNNIDNAEFIAADLKDKLPSLLTDDVKAIIADPSRAGLGEENAKTLCKVKGPLRLCVIFCSLTALKRDLPVLVKGGYKVKFARGFDMFPYTTAVETAVFLEKE